MDKITRMLMLYHRLMRGQTIYKTTYALEFDITERSFDRDIQDMRRFLSESFSYLDLVYEEDRMGYYLKNLHLKREIAIGETYILSKLLLDSRPLRTDDQAEMVHILLTQLTPEMRERVLPVLRHTPEIPDRYDKISVKLIEDFLLSIQRKDRVKLQFGTEYKEVGCVPYSVEFRDRSTYLVAWELESSRARLYPLDDIKSYVPIKQPYILSLREQEQLQRLIHLVYESEPESYRDYIHNKEVVIHDSI